MKTTISAPENKQIEVKIVSREFKVTDSILERIEEKIATIEKFVKEKVKVIVTLNSERENKGVKIVVHVNKKTLKASAQTQDLYEAIDSAFSKIKRQIIKTPKAYKSKRFKLKRNSKVPMAKKCSNISQRRFNNDESLKPMFKAEAREQMLILGLKYFHYLDSETFKPTVMKNDLWHSA